MDVVEFIFPDIVLGMIRQGSLNFNAVDLEVRSFPGQCHGDDSATASHIKDAAVGRGINGGGKDDGINGESIPGCRLTDP